VAPKVVPRTEREELSADSTAVPNLAPSVPGLDSVVIPAPLDTPRSTWGTTLDERRAPVSDPDGVFDER
jgi:hypothetical protein